MSTKDRAILFTTLPGPQGKRKQFRKPIFILNKASTYSIINYVERLQGIK